MRALTVRVTGRVQGVGYRAWVEGEAVALGIRGWVRNRADGSVEGLLAGPDEIVDQLIASLWDGPPAARVEGVSVTEASDPGSIGFRTLPTS
jgi:acylphosphatase